MTEGFPQPKPRVLADKGWHRLPHRRPNLGLSRPKPRTVLLASGISPAYTNASAHAARLQHPERHAMSTEHANSAQFIRTLLVDDCPSFLGALTRLLAHAPQVLVIATAINGAEALKAVARCAPDLALIDVAMPGMSGIEVTRQLNR